MILMVSSIVIDDFGVGRDDVSADDPDDDR